MLKSEKALEDIEQFIDEKISDLLLDDAINVLKFLIENTQIKLEAMELDSLDYGDE